jgi:4a-hydroxytetrahydrobiopterin dehydratase
MDDICQMAQKQCVPCSSGTPPLKGPELAELHEKLGHGWQVIDEHHLEKEFKFKTYRDAVSFVNRVAALAESVNHHPDLSLAYAKVRVTLWTHKIGGLSETDFIFAAKVEEASKP